eukprot:416233_1
MLSCLLVVTHLSYMSRFFLPIYTHVLIAACVLTIAKSQSTPKQVVFTSQNPNNDGATVAVIGDTGEVTSSSATWNITSQRDDTWHLVVNLDNSWGFDATYESNITFEMDGVLADDLIFAFTTPKLDKYIAIRIREKFPATIAPKVGTFSCKLSGSAPLVVGNVTTAIKTGGGARSDRLGLWDMTTSCDLLLGIQGAGNKTFPIKFTLINKPSVNSLHFMVASGGIDENYVEHCFYEAFDTNQGLQIYFAVDDDQAVAIVNSLTVTYATAAPVTSSDTPTKYPTDGPIISTTLHPTKYPTAMPLKAPSKDPTEAPITTTNTPSKSQTKHPLIMPTKTPSDNPSYPTEASKTPNPSTDGRSSRQVTDGIATSRTNDPQTETETDNLFWNPISILLSIIAGVILMFCCICVMYAFVRQKSKSNVSHLSQLQLQSMSNGSSKNMVTAGGDRIEMVGEHMRKPSDNDLLDEVEGHGNNEDNKQAAIQTNTGHGDEDDFIVQGSSDEGEDDHVTEK